MDFSEFPEMLKYIEKIKSMNRVLLPILLNEEPQIELYLIELQTELDSLRLEYTPLQHKCSIYELINRSYKKWKDNLEVDTPDILLQLNEVVVVTEFLKTDNFDLLFESDKNEIRSNFLGQKYSDLLTSFPFSEYNISRLHKYLYSFQNYLKSNEEFNTISSAISELNIDDLKNAMNKFFKFADPHSYKLNGTILNLFETLKKYCLDSANKEALLSMKHNENLFNKALSEFVSHYRIKTKLNEHFLVSYQSYKELLTKEKEVKKKRDETLERIETITTIYNQIVIYRESIEKYFINES